MAIIDYLKKKNLGGGIYERAFCEKISEPKIFSFFILRLTNLKYGRTQPHLLP